MTNRWGNNGNSDRPYFLGLQKHCGQWLSWNKNTLAPWRESYGKPRQHIKKQRHHFANKCLYSQSYVFSSSHVWMWELDCKEVWTPKNWSFRIGVQEKTLESPLDYTEIKAIDPKGNQTWTFIGGTDAEAEAEASVLWPPDEKNRLIGKDPDAGKGWGQEKRMTEDEMVGWHHWHNRHEFEQTLEDGEGQGSRACYSHGSQRVGHDLVTEQEQQLMANENILL